MKKKWKVKIWSKFDVELGIEVEVEATEKEMQEIKISDKFRMTYELSDT
jgi:hypothetical protein|tara:strand:+ start:810 stop:956 length:147 start_codon:yes stop_codon:yes gene_type:complete